MNCINLSLFLSLLFSISLILDQEANYYPTSLLRTKIDISHDTTVSVILCLHMLVMCRAPGTAQGRTCREVKERETTNKWKKANNVAGRLECD